MVMVVVMVVVPVPDLYDDLRVDRSVEGEGYKQGTKCEQTSLHANVHELPPEPNVRLSTSVAIERGRNDAGGGGGRLRMGEPGAVLGITDLLYAHCTCKEGAADCTCKEGAAWKRCPVCFW
jgi:hypothetical protein